MHIAESPKLARKERCGAPFTARLALASLRMFFANPSSRAARAVMNCDIASIVAWDWLIMYLARVYTSATSVTADNISRWLGGW